MTTITRLTVLLCCLFITTQAISQNSLTASEKKAIEEKADALVQDYMDLDIFSGVVLIAEKGKPFYHKAFGLANREEGKKNTLETRFDIGSMNKTFTKVVVYQLMQEGKLQFNATLGTYLYGFDKEKAGKITVQNLLNHTSGFGDYHDQTFWETPLEEKTIDWVTQKARTMPLLFEPGKEQEYSNTGYVLLGAIIEKVTGKSYYENIRERIVQPLNLMETELEYQQHAENRAIGYWKSPTGELRNNTEFLGLPKPDGGFFSTTTDILKFYQKYNYGKLIPDALKKEDRYFQFLEKIKNEPGAALPQAGGYEGSNTVMYEMPSRQLTIIVFANMDEPVAELLGEGILHIINGKEPQRPVLPARQNVYQAWQKYGTDYVKEHFEELTVNFHPADPKDFILNSIGYDLLFSGKVEEAITIFTLNTELFPDVANTYDSLAEAWLEKGERTKALELYKKALSINPDLLSAQQKVKELENR